MKYSLQILFSSSFSWRKLNQFHEERNYKILICCENVCLNTKKMFEIIFERTNWSLIPNNNRTTIYLKFGLLNKAEWDFCIIFMNCASKNLSVFSSYLKWNQIKKTNLLLF